MTTYLLRVKPKGAIRWREARVALHAPDETAALVAAVPSVINRRARAGDQIEVLNTKRQVLTKKFTVV